MANPPPKIRWAVFLGIACLALAVRLPRLGERPMHTDEAVNGYITGQLLAGEKYQYDSRDRHGPALYALAWPLARIAGEHRFSDLTEATLRLGPVLVGAGTILLFGAAAVQTGFAAAVVAALLFAFGPLAVYYNRYFIHESLFVAATLGLLLAGWRFLSAWQTSPPNERLPLKYAALTGFCAALMLACKETAVLHFAAAGAAGLWFLLSLRRRGEQLHWRKGIKGGVIAPAIFLFVLLALYTWGGRHWQGPVDLLRSIPHLAGRAGGEGHEKPFWYYVTLLGNGWSGWIVLVFALIGGISVARRMLSRPRTPEAGAPGLMLELLLVYAMAIAVIYSSIPYKTPWLALNLWLPITLLAGQGCLMCWGAAKSKLVRGLFAPAGVAMAVLLGSDIKEHVFSDPAGERNPYAYAHTVEDIVRLPARISSLAGRDSRRDSPPSVSVIAADPWPLPWYLRRFPQTGFWQPGQEPRAADFYVTSPEATDLPGARLESRRPEFFGIRPEVLVILWVPETQAP